MPERLEAYLDELRRRLRRQAEPEALDELLLEIRAHHEAALELFADREDPDEAALELLGSPEVLAATYRRENAGGSRAALVLALLIAAFFYLQPLYYFATDKADYLLRQPLVWVNVALCFLVACIWLRKRIFRHLAATVVALSAVTTVWLAANFLWAPDAGPVVYSRYPLVRTWEARRGLEGFRRHAPKGREMLRKVIQSEADAFARADTAADLPETAMSTGQLSRRPTFLVREAVTPSDDWTDFQTAKAEWMAWRKTILPVLDAQDRREDAMAAQVEDIICRGGWGSGFPLACLAFGYGALVLLILTLLNSAGCALARALDRIGDRLRPGAA